MLRQFKVGGRRLWVARRWVRFQNGRRIYVESGSGVGERVCEFGLRACAAAWTLLAMLGLASVAAACLIVAGALLAAGVGIVIAIGGLPLWVWIWLL